MRQAMTETIAVLVVEDDERLASFTAEYFADHEVDVTHVKLARGNDEKPLDRAVDVQISRMRHKPSAYPGGARLIRTVRGVGDMPGESP